MKKTILFLSLIGSMSLMGGCSSGDDPEIDEPIKIDLTRSEENAVKAVNDFAFDLMRSTEDLYSEHNPNYMISPQGAAWTIAMAANGATPGSETEREMLDALRLGNDATIQDVNDYSSKLIKAVTARGMESYLNVANALYYKSEVNVNPSFVESLRTFYAAEPFENPTNSKIDNWISRQTDGMINNFAERLKLDDTLLGVLNTILFQGKWTGFDPKDTKPAGFRNADGTESLVPTMKGQKNGYRSGDEMCHYFRLNFSGASFSISFIIPTEGHSIDELHSYLSADRLDNLRKTAYVETLNLWIPRISLANDLDLAKVANNMGIRKAFSGEAEFSGITGTTSLHISNFDQSVKMDWTEEGVKVAATTDLGFGTSSSGSDFFYLDEPFYFFITEESTGAILFSGKVSQL